MGFFSRNKKSGKRVARARGRNIRLNKQLRAQGINPDAAYCTECNEWYNVQNQSAVNRHAH